MVKAIANRRGWEHQGHRELFRVARWFRDETETRGRPTALRPGALPPVNFYEDWLDPETVAAGRDDVERFLDKLEPVLGISTQAVPARDLGATGPGLLGVLATVNWFT